MIGYIRKLILRLMISIHVSVRGAQDVRETVVQFKRSDGDPYSVYFYFNRQGDYSGSNFTIKLGGAWLNSTSTSHRPPQQIKLAVMPTPAKALAICIIVVLAIGMLGALGQIVVHDIIPTFYFHDPYI